MYRLSLFYADSGLHNSFQNDAFIFILRQQAKQMDPTSSCKEKCQTVIVSGVRAKCLAPIRTCAIMPTSPPLQSPETWKVIYWKNLLKPLNLAGHCELFRSRAESLPAPPPPPHTHHHQQLQVKPCRVTVIHTFLLRDTVHVVLTLRVVLVKSAP